jgi:hypothetical protein
MLALCGQQEVRLRKEREGSREAFAAPEKRSVIDDDSAAPLALDQRYQKDKPRMLFLAAE